MDIFHISPRDLTVFLLILFRIGGLFISAPVLSSQSIPMQIKAGLCLFASVLLYPTVSGALPAVPGNAVQLAGYAVQETGLGLLIGFTANFVFWGIQAAGEVVAREMGLSMAEIYDPVLEMQTSIVGQFNVVIATMMFLILNGHHWILRAVISSFKAVPLGTFVLTSFTLTSVVQMSCQVFIIAIKLSAPVFVALFLITAILGIMERMIPQMHMFAIGFPLKIGVGFIMLLLSMEFTSYMFNKFFLMMNNDLDLLLVSMRGG